MRIREKNYIVWILAGAFLLRVISLNQSLWLDEAIGAIAVHDYSYQGIITDYIKGDTHPPLYYLTLKFWTSLFGYSEIAMRSLSVLFGVLTVYVVYKIAQIFPTEKKQVTKNKAKLGIIAALLMATAPLHIYYSQEVRMYAMNTLLSSLLVLWFLKNDFKKYSVTLLLLAMTDYLPLLVTFALSIYAFTEKRKRTWWRMFLLSHIPAALFLIFWFPTFLVQSTGSREALRLFPGWGDLIGRAGVKELVLVWIKFLIGRISFESNVYYIFIVGTVSLFFGTFLLRSFFELKYTKLFWVWFLVPIILAFVGSTIVPGFSYFRLIISLPAFYLLIGYAVSLSQNPYKYLFPLLLLNVLFSSLYLFNKAYWREDWKASVNYVTTNSGANDIVLQLFPEPFAGYRWYTKNSGLKAYGATKKLGANDEEIEMNVQSLVQNKEGVFYYEYLQDQTDPNGITKLVLKNNNFKQEKVVDFRGIGFVEYWKK